MSRRGLIPATICGVSVTSIDPGTITTVLCDLDGVVWLAHRPIPGSPEAVAALRQSGRRVLFVTNNSAATRAQHEAALADVGIPAVGDVVSSSMAAARLVEPGERVLVAGGPGIVEALEERGAVAVLNDGTVTDGRFDAVVVGLHREFDYQRMNSAAAAVRAGARLIGTNGDSTYPTPEGLLPGGGAILAAIATAAGVAPVVAGKPNSPMAEMIRMTVGSTQRPFSPGATLMVGDRFDTDGRFAEHLDCPFALVRTGVTEPVDQASSGIADVAVDQADLAAVAEWLLGAPIPAAASRSDDQRSW